MSSSGKPESDGSACLMPLVYWLRCLGEHGAVYSVAEIGEWLEAARWTMRGHVALAGPDSLVVGEAV